MIINRIFDIIFSLLGIIILLPLFMLISFAIINETNGGILYKQFRVGKNNVNFTLYKFRSMSVGADKKGLLTIGQDNRITKVGAFIRKYKLDELPQLVNVLIGNMSLVGPRPEVRKYVNLYSKEQMKVLSVRPGITDFASIEFIDENNILAKTLDPEKTYIEEIMQKKIKLNMKYINEPNYANYFKILYLTVKKIVS